MDLLGDLGGDGLGGEDTAGDRRGEPRPRLGSVFEDLLAGWDGEEVAVRYDEPTATWMFVGVHSTVLGPAMGGTRMKPYGAPQDGLRDVLRLSGAMTYKQAAAGVPYGGGKAVLAVPDVPAPGSADRRRLLLRYAELVESLHGTYVTAADMNTAAPDMDVIGERTSHVLGRSREHGGAGDPAPGTALGVFHGIRSAWRHATGSADLSDVTVLIQGVGSVGDRLADHLEEAGAGVLAADVDPARAEKTADRVGGSAVEAEAVIGHPCDVYAPCATGAVLTAETIPRLACRVVAGAANNQLGEPEDAALLSQRGILYAPDYVINAGGVIHLAGYETLGWDDAMMHARLSGIGETLAGIFETAATEGITTAEAADRLAEARIAAGRAG
jgi:glutamate dehydrogenase/leucine dehydrogenase